MCACNAEQNIVVCEKHKFEHIAGLTCPVCELIQFAGTWDNVWKHHSDESQQQELLVRGSILAYECCKFVDSVAKLVSTNERAEIRAYEAEMFMDLADVIAQTILYCFKNGWDYRKIAGFTEWHFMNADIEECAKHMSIQGGKVLRLATYAHLNQDDLKKCRSYVEKSKVHASNIMMICRFVCTLFGRVFDDVADMGKVCIRKRTVHMMFTDTLKRGE